jgi:hypothetical protein
MLARRGVAGAILAVVVLMSLLLAVAAIGLRELTALYAIAPKVLGVRAFRSGGAGRPAIRQARAAQ